MPLPDTSWQQLPVFRSSWHCVLRPDAESKLSAALAEFSQGAEALRLVHKLLTASVFRYQNHLFLYWEPIGTALFPAGLSPLLDKLLEPWPPLVGGGSAPRLWAEMQPYFYHDIPTTAGTWQRGTSRGEKHGRIAVLKPGKWCSYMQHHLDLMREGLVEGDRWHLICVQENLLFSYLEEPRTYSNTRHTPGAFSGELARWLRVDPESHFAHFAPEQQTEPAPNFVYLPRCAGTLD